MKRQPPAGGAAGGLAGQLAEGVRLQQAGRLAEAEACYRRILAANPRQPDALHLLGMVAFQAGHPQAALGLLDQAVAINRRQPHFQLNRGAVLMRLGRRDEAVEAFARAVALDSTLVNAQLNLGLALAETGRAEDGLKHLRRAHQLAPKAAEVAASLANVLAALGRPGEAEPLLRNALAAGHSPARAGLIKVLLETDRAAEARGLAEAEIAAAPTAAAHDLLGRACAALGNLPEAIAAFRRALALDPAHLGAATGLGNALADGGHHGEAEKVYREALARHGNPRLMMNIGLALSRQGHGAEAVDWLGRALAADPDNANAGNARGHVLMTMGRFAEGLPDLEYRWRKDRAAAETPWRSFPAPLWDGGPIDGRLLVWAEQGVGDHLMNARFLTALAQRGISAVVEVDARLIGLLERTYPQHAFVAVQDPPDPATRGGDIAAQVPLGSLLLRLGITDAAQVPPPARLAADPQKVDHWRHWLGSLGPGPHVGLSWRSKRKEQGVNKSLGLGQWGKILRDRAARFVVLQYGDVDAEVAAAEAAFGCPILVPPDLDRLDDMEGMAALITALDLVVTTSSVTAHLAGSVETPTLLMLEKVPLWYWGMGGEKTFFYPAIRAFRQPAPGEWEPVVGEVAKALNGISG